MYFLICPISINSVGYRQENVLFGAYFGGHLEYANLHINWETSSKYSYKNETHTIKTVGCREFGCHIEYANEPNLHIMWETSSSEIHTMKTVDCRQENMQFRT